MIPQNFKHLGFNYVKFVTKACRHGTSHPQHPRTIVSKRGISCCSDTPEHGSRGQYHPQEQMLLKLQMKMKGEVAHLPTEDIYLLGFHREKNFPNLEISGRSALQGNRGCIAHGGVTSRRPFRDVSFCLSVIHDPGNPLLRYRLSLLIKHLALCSWLMWHKMFIFLM